MRFWGPFFRGYLLKKIKTAVGWVVSFASTANFDPFWSSSGMFPFFCLYGVPQKNGKLRPFLEFQRHVSVFCLFGVPQQNGKLRPFLEFQRHVSVFDLFSRP